MVDNSLLPTISITQWWVDIFCWLLSEGALEPMGPYQKQRERLKYGFCRQLLLYKCNSDQLNTFFIKIRFAISPQSNFDEKSVQQKCCIHWFCKKIHILIKCGCFDWPKKVTYNPTLLECWISRNDFLEVLWGTSDLHFSLQLKIHDTAFRMPKVLHFKPIFLPRTLIFKFVWTRREWKELGLSYTV